MPGLENGTNAANAFPWDHDAYPGGTRVTGDNTANGNDWWAVKLLAGQLYTFETINPSYGDTYLYLYDTDGASQLTSDDDGGAGTWSRMTYTPLVDGVYFVMLGDNYGTGSYTLECTPAPELWVTRIFASAVSRHAARAMLSAQAASVSDHLKPFRQASVTTRHDQRATAMRNVASHHDTRGGNSAGQTSRFVQWKPLRYGAGLSRINQRRGTGERNASAFDICVKQLAKTVSRSSVIVASHAETVSRNLASTPMATRHASRINALWRKRYRVRARDLATGAYLELGITENTSMPDVAIPDGTYEIEVLVDDLYWRDVRGRGVVSLVADSAEPPVAGLPSVLGLRANVSDGRTYIVWDTSIEAEEAGIRFGVWFGATIPVDVSGEPAYTIPYYSERETVRVLRLQTAVEYVAVRAYTTTTEGAVSELLLPWPSSPPVSPVDQYATM